MDWVTLTKSERDARTSRNFIVQPSFSPIATVPILAVVQMNDEMIFNS